MGLGRVDPHNHSESFCMTVLAFKTSRRANAVSNLHGVVSRRMWHSLWPYRSEEEIPIGHITNGVHVSTWLAHQMRVLYDKVLPANWHLKSGEPEVWAGFERVTPAELWETHQSLKNRLIGVCPRVARQTGPASEAVGSGLPGPRERARSPHVDDRFRPTVRPLQTGRPDHPRHRPTRPSGR